MVKLQPLRDSSRRHPARFVAKPSPLNKSIIPSTYALGLLLGFAILLLLPAGALAQQFPGRAGETPNTADKFVVSVRDLKIPLQARDAFLEANRRLARNDFSGGVYLLRRAIAKFPDYYEAYFLLGIAEISTDHQADAETAFRKAIVLSAGARYAQPYFALGLLLCDQKHFTEAVETIQAGLDLDGDDWSGHFGMGRALLGLDRLEDAEKSVRRSIAVRADLREGYLLLADIHARQNDQSAVLQDLDDYIALDPDEAMRNRVRSVRDDIQRSLSLQSNATAAEN